MSSSEFRAFSLLNKEQKSEFFSSSSWLEPIPIENASTALDSDPFPRDLKELFALNQNNILGLFKYLCCLKLLRSSRVMVASLFENLSLNFKSVGAITNVRFLHR